MSSDIDEAAAAVSGGRLVVLPTDTVYGVGADAFSPNAVNALLAAKGRGRDMPVPVLVGSWSTVDGIASRVTGEARELIEAFWPGPLSIVLPQMPTLAWDLGDAGGTVMVRMPLHPMALELLESRPGRWRSAAPTVPASRRPSPSRTRVRSSARRSRSTSTAARRPGPVPSTIVDASLDGPPRVLRLGTLTGDDLRAVVPDDRRLSPSYVDDLSVPEHARACPCTDQSHPASRVASAPLRPPMCPPTPPSHGRGDQPLLASRSAVLDQLQLGSVRGHRAGAA